MKTIDREEIRQILEAGAPLVLLEALPAPHFEAGHLPGALHLPHDRAEVVAATVIPGRKSRVVVYCASDTCQNSHTAAAALERLGYSDVRVYVGGKKDWEAAGLPLERGGAPARE